MKSISKLTLAFLLLILSLFCLAETKKEIKFQALELQISESEFNSILKSPKLESKCRSVNTCSKPIIEDKVCTTKMICDL